MKIIKLFALLFAAAFSAQSFRFVYEVKITADSTKPEKASEEAANLDLNAEKSVFYSAAKLKMDSLFDNARRTRNFNIDFGKMKSKIDYIIEKNRKTGEITYSDRISSDIYSYVENRKFNWKLLPDTLKIAEYNCQKAETEFAGRKWTAWFTMDLPFPDGPYKFSGLPGLIVKISDEKNFYSFDLIEVKNIGEMPEIKLRGFGQTIKVPREKFYQQLLAYKQNPGAFFMRNTPAGANVKMFIRENGGQEREITDIDKFRREMNQKALEEIKENNNPIELE